MPQGRDINELNDRKPEAWPPASVLVWLYFPLPASQAVRAWFYMADNHTSWLHPVINAVLSIVGAFVFWLLATNWRGWAKGVRIRSLTGEPGRVARVQSRPVRIAASIVALLVVLIDLLVIGLVLAQ